MKRSTPNHQHILWGMLMVTLGLSKAWLQTAAPLETEIIVGQRDLNSMVDTADLEVHTLSEFNSQSTRSGTLNSRKSKSKTLVFGDGFNTSTDELLNIATGSKLELVPKSKPSFSTAELIANQAFERASIERENKLKAERTKSASGGSASRTLAPAGESTARAAAAAPASKSASPATAPASSAPATRASKPATSAAPTRAAAAASAAPTSTPARSTPAATAPATAASTSAAAPAVNPNDPNTPISTGASHTMNAATGEVQKSDRIYTVKVNGKTYNIRAIIKQRKATGSSQDIQQADGSWAPADSQKYETVATFPDACLVGACIEDTVLSTVAGQTVAQIESSLNPVIEELLAAKLATKEVVENTKNQDDCSTKIVNGEEIDISSDYKYAKDRYKCLAKNLKESEEYKEADREERREMLQDELIDSLQEDLKNAQSDRERKQIMSAINAVDDQFGRNSDVGSQLKAFRTGAEDYNKIARLSHLMAKFPNMRMQLMPQMMALKNKYDPVFNRQLSCVTAGDLGLPYTTQNVLAARGCPTSATRDVMIDWSDEIMPLAQEALDTPSTVASRFYADNEYPVDNLATSHRGFVNGGALNIPFSDDMRIVRRDMDMYGISGLPQFSDRYGAGGGGRNFNGGGRFNGGFDGGFSGGGRFNGGFNGDNRYNGGFDGGFTGGGRSRFDSRASAFGNNFGSMDCRPNQFGTRMGQNYDDCGNYPASTGFSRMDNFSGFNSRIDNFSGFNGGGRSQFSGGINPAFRSNSGMMRPEYQRPGQNMQPWQQSGSVFNRGEFNTSFY